MKSRLLLLSFCSLLLSGCGVTQLIKDANRTVKCSIIAGEQATEMVYRNIEAMEKANRLLEENIRLMEHTNRAMKEMQEHSEQSRAPRL